MELVGYRVCDFRSVNDSGWIETSEITAFIGTNESGKTNLLVPLWKFNPAKDGVINPIQDYPRNRYGTIREMTEKPVFIEVKFRLSNNISIELSEYTLRPSEQFNEVIVKRDYSGKYHLDFPNLVHKIEPKKEDIISILNIAFDDINALNITVKAEENIKENAISLLGNQIKELESIETEINIQILKKIKDHLDEIDISKGSKRSTIVPRIGQVMDEFDDYISFLEMPDPRENEKVYETIINHLPTFVYYSNYGNLDSEIYLPQIIQNMSRDDIGIKEAAKARTLKVLFDFVRLKPQEIMDLGVDFQQGATPTEQQIAVVAEKKKERDILLQSAGTELTGKFRDWWKQGDYRFRFQADGNYFRIWVSDDKRPEDIELESRSTGLQWFLSFYLVFLVESSSTHKNSILLLDEPGVSLHPIAQRDLALFFENLSSTNQIIYTTHSPFMVDSNHLDRVKAVYVDDRGLTSVSSDLRAGEKKANQSQSIYPVHAALGLTISDVLLQGCYSVIVEGPSDQIYLSSIKNYLIGRGLITPNREVIFIPSGGVKGIQAVASIITGKGQSLPYCIVDGDLSGIGISKKLKDGLYNGQEDRVILVNEIINFDNAEIEDILSGQFLANVATNYLPKPEDTEEDFMDVFEVGKPIVPQIEHYAITTGIQLEKGWKVELSKRSKTSFSKNRTTFEPEFVDKWIKLFQKIQHN
ncbi:AAA family ATPase [Paenibacillus sp. FSL H7-0331]|uniref:AAA family ATPase n=1 Tax=Paenibacillus sp. FSL H7-0331 TaxID=1920421 RepID=UPI00096C1F99|nr:AAA family ATPase [Paenibacillus sp. FSL H7-0331]OME97893.1 OLD family endonuclease [Paenibacillus sp. FSL H7-0331]